MLQAARNQPKLKTQSSKEKITKIIKVRRICYYGHLLRRDQPTYSALRYTTTERKVGRPIYTWEDSLRQDLNYHNRNQEEWDTLAQNKMEMKKPRMNYTNSQKRTPKALHRVKKMKNRRLTGKQTYSRFLIHTNATTMGTKKNKAN
ncbi:hypothetical protein EVAR_6745_1 [Eumeta japonica]|uniref:Uncharacterized protein n=1 Tax=Eumeta variegata TaxID=151549 RepID=A0A4C1V546_EUMVA|nr:hypothetical protein EVAR_6745_1 [Eumeta japonica]